MAGFCGLKPGPVLNPLKHRGQVRRIFTVDRDWKSHFSKRHNSSFESTRSPFANHRTASPPRPASPSFPAVAILLD
jgi:hypothetical protein